MEKLKNENQWFIIINPIAGNGLVKKQWQKIQIVLKENGFSYDFAFTERKGHAGELVKIALKNGFRKFIAVGGDGTNYEVINGYFNQKIVDTNEIFHSLIPVGTGNDWRRTYKIHSDFKKWIPQLKNEKKFSQDIGVVKYMKEGKSEKRYFANVAGMSFDAFVVRYAENCVGYSSGKFYYLWMLLKNIFKYKIPKAKIYINDKELSGQFYTINAGIGKFSGSGMQLVPHSIPDDGKLAITIARKLSKIGVIFATPLFYSGKIQKHPKVSIYKTNTLKIVSEDSLPVLVEADGEFLGESPVEISVMPKVLNIFIP